MLSHTLLDTSQKNISVYQEIEGENISLFITKQYKGYTHLIEDPLIITSIQDKTNIITIYDVNTTEKSVRMEYANYGSLYGVLSCIPHSKSPISEDIIYGIFIQIVNGVRCLIESGLCHFKLSLRNILVDKYGCVKLSGLRHLTKLKYPLSNEKV